MEGFFFSRRVTGCKVSGVMGVPLAIEDYFLVFQLTAERVYELSFPLLGSYLIFQGLRSIVRRSQERFL